MAICNCLILCRMFYHFIASLKMKSAEAQATRTHSWFKELQEMGVLGRVYTQNIDDLDKKAGLTTGYGKHSHAVQLHGDLDTVHCTLCKHSQAFDDDLVKAFHDGQWPHCPSCTIFCEGAIEFLILNFFYRSSEKWKTECCCRILETRNRSLQ